ncbi:MAG: (4Fe-4S)-binding protein [Deltaproteobacteria bacterium]|nr:MAG: (4Fe-4S)-binding protein [Deltaproteobacteria bacterium]
MIISIASGKGGTGKTTVSTNYARVMEDVLLLDCDVEEPNAHLFLKPAFNHSEKVYTEIPQVDQEKCIGCGKCAEVCRFRAMTVVGGRVMVFPELCHSCGGCMVACPEDAVAAGQREIGTIETGRIGGINLVKGTLRVGEVMAPPLIEKVRDFAGHDQLVLIDAPPGTSCPVIAAMRDADFVVLVTEPTPFGLNDLVLAVETVREIGLPFGLVINRAGLGSDEIYRYVERENIPVLMEIPFDLEIARAYSQGEMLVDKFPELRGKFLAFHKKIAELTAVGGVQ